MTYRYFRNETTRSSLLRAVADTENEAAWTHLFDLYAGFVFSLARYKGLNDEDADDIVQIVFMDFARNAPTFRYDRAKGRFRSYLASLVNWRVTDKFRSAKRAADFLKDYGEDVAEQERQKQKPVSPEEAAFIVSEWESAALEEALRRMKSDVRPDHYAAFVARSVEGQDMDAVCALHGLTRDNLYQILHRLTVRLRETIAEVLKEMDDPR